MDDAADGGAYGRTGRWRVRELSRKRVVRHVLFGVMAVVATVLVYALQPPPDWRHRLSLGTAYASLGFLVWSLLLGPWNVLSRRPNPVSSDLRRDVSIWAGVLALAHTAVGLTVHLRGRMWMYFFKRLHPLHVQSNAFGAANYLGLVAAILFALLLLISNDASLRAMGARRWKRWQRWAYAAVVLTVAHGWIFQSVENRHLPWRVLLYVVTALMLSLQLAGAVRARRGAGDRFGRFERDRRPANLG